MKYNYSIKKGNVFVALIMAMVSGLAALTTTIVVIPGYQQLLEIWMAGTPWDRAATATTCILVVYGVAAYIFSLIFQTHNKRVIGYFFVR